MLLILLAMIIGSSLSAFSLPAANSAASGLSSLRLSPQRLSGDAPFNAPSTGPLESSDPTRPLQRGSLLNLSV